MIQITPQMRVLVGVEPADFRAGIDGLAERCRKVLETDPFSGAVFVFRNKRRTAIKVLVYDSCGAPTYVKWLARGHCAAWNLMEGTPHNQNPGGQSNSSQARMDSSACQASCVSVS
jgi:hypothetical protein